MTIKDKIEIIISAAKFDTNNGELETMISIPYLSPDLIQEVKKIANQSTFLFGLTCIIGTAEEAEAALYQIFQNQRNCNLYPLTLPESISKYRTVIDKKHVIPSYKRFRRMLLSTAFHPYESNAINDCSLMGQYVDIATVKFISKESRDKIGQLYPEGFRPTTHNELTAFVCGPIAQALKITENDAVTKFSFTNC